MQPLEEKDSSPLEDTEITRLIKVSREVGYKKQDKIPERNLVDFKPTSISQIASINNKKRTQMNQSLFNHHKLNKIKSWATENTLDDNLIRTKSQTMLMLVKFARGQQKGNCKTL